MWAPRLGRGTRMGLLEKRKQKVAEGVAAYLEPGESVQAVAMVQTRVPAALTAIAGFLAKVHAVVATERNLYVVAISSVSVSKVTGVVAKEPLAATSAQRQGGSLTVAGTRYYILLGAGDDVDRILAMTGTPGAVAAR